MECGILSRRGFVAASASALAASALCAGLPAAKAAEASPGIAPGTGTASARGFGGDVVVSVTVDAQGLVTDVAVDASAETPERGGRAARVMEQAMADVATVRVDGVAGATVTSDAVRTAAARAYALATGASDDSAVSVKMKPGVYTGYAKGYWGIWDLPVSVTVNETSILKLETPAYRYDHGETEVVLDSVKNDLFGRIVEAQSLAIDATTGATVSSNAVFSAVRDAIRQALEAAGTDVSAEVAFEVPPAPAPVPEPEIRDVDVLVVGLGAGGIMAMKSACEAMQEVNRPGNSRGWVSILGIDRAGKFGGRSAMAHEACAVNPPVYCEVFNDGKPLVDEAKFKQAWLDFMTTDGQMKGKPEILDLFFEESGKTIDWLRGQGWIFGSPGMPNDGLGGTVGFNVGLTSFMDEGTFEDRRKINNAYYTQMLDAVRAQGGDYLLDTEGYELLMNGDRCVGVKARNVHTGQEYVINAKAIIMNTGGFLASPELLDELLPEVQRGPRLTISMGTDTGLMIRAALDAGAGTFNADTTPMCPCASTDHWLARYPFNFYDYVDWRGRQAPWTLNNIPGACGNMIDALAVNKDGERFMDESAFADVGFGTDHDACSFYQSGTYHWRIVSDELLREVAQNGFTTVVPFDGYRFQGNIPEGLPVPEVYEGLDFAVEEGMAVKADTVAGLAEQMGVDPAVLQATLDAYNASCEAGEDAEFGKPAMYLKTELTPPFYALKMYAFAYVTCGALDVDEQIRVLRSDHQTPIEGLYAIGSDSLGVLMNPDRSYPGCGSCQGWLWTSGRLAGRNAVDYIVERCGGLTDVSPALPDKYLA